MFTHSCGMSLSPVCCSLNTSRFHNFLKIYSYLYSIAVWESYKIFYHYLSQAQEKARNMFRFFQSLSNMIFVSVAMLQIDLPIVFQISWGLVFGTTSWCGHRSFCCRYEVLPIKFYLSLPPDYPSRKQGRLLQRVLMLSSAPFTNMV